MNSDQLKELSRIKKLVTENKKRFANRFDRDYIEDLLELGITEEEAWQHILSLNQHSYVPDAKPNYSVGHSALVFNKPVNGKMAYIKIKIEKYDGEEAVCISFHKK